MTETPTGKEATQSTMGALTALDASIRATTGGEAGAGLYTLLDMLAGQFLGVPRTAFTPAPPATREQQTRTQLAANPTGEGEDMPLPNETEDESETHHTPPKHRRR